MGQIPGDLNAVVTGASSGIGRAIAVAVAASARSLCLVGRDEERLEGVAREARAKARFVLPYQADLTVDAAINVLGERLKHEFNGLDVLVHCAGAFALGSVEKTPVQELDALYRANVHAPLALTRTLLPLLIPRQGQIVFINSTQGLHRGGANSGAFASTQHALRTMADHLRQEVNAEGVRVLSIYLGRTATPRMKALFALEGRPYRPELLLQPEDVALVVMNALCMPRTAEITNIEMRPLIKSY
jgi:NADP-dependent 3-hydroxy acid dehydrogenase YdfG